MAFRLTIPWMRRNFLLRRRLDRVFVDPLDAVWRRVMGRADWPPYSLRAFVGGLEDFEPAGRWFLDEFKRLKVLAPRSRMLDIGCGCGRLALRLARDEELAAWQVLYTGMDIDRSCVEWCRRAIGRYRAQFQFYCLDRFSASYNREGAVAFAALPHAAGSFDLIIATSVFTHILPAQLEHYVAEAARLLTNGGVLYASFFLLGRERREISFPVVFGHYAIHRADFPENAVAYDFEYLTQLGLQHGLQLRGQPQLGIQDILLFTREPEAHPAVRPGEGWHALEGGTWRWTESEFTVVVGAEARGRAVLRFSFVIAAAGESVALSARTSVAKYPTRIYTSQGLQVYEAEIRVEAVGELTITFQAVRQGAMGVDLRDLGVLVSFERYPLSLLASA